MARSNSRSAKKTFTVAQANATLPLVRAIVRDISELALSLRDRQDRLARLNEQGREGNLSTAHDEELRQVEAELERGQESMRDYIRELLQLGVELKDPFTGLVDFPSQFEGREVYLCWRLGEPDVGHWHELDAGFAGRQKLKPGGESVPLSAGGERGRS